MLHAPRVSLVPILRTMALADNIFGILHLFCLHHKLLTIITILDMQFVQLDILLCLLFLSYVS